MTTSTNTIADDFVRAAGGPVPPGDGLRARIAAILRAQLEDARRQWPTVHVSPPQFAHKLGESVCGAADLAEALTGLHAGELYLCAACERGDAKALAAFEQRYFAEAARLHASYRSPICTLDELCSDLRNRLFVADASGPPRIARYRGSGPLGHWVRIVASRALVDRHRARTHREVALEPELLSRMPEPARNPELAYLQRHYGAEFKASFHRALAALTARERNVLRMSVLESLSIDAIAAIYDTHRATAARWVASARNALSQRTLREFSAQIGLRGDQLDSVIGLIRSRLEVSLDRVLDRGREIEPNA